jgi:hypothetical protein
MDPGAFITRAFANLTQVSFCKLLDGYMIAMTPAAQDRMNGSSTWLSDLGIPPSSRVILIFRNDLGIDESRNHNPALVGDISSVEITSPPPCPPNITAMVNGTNFYIEKPSAEDKK